jgi:hypothetical protein
VGSATTLLISCEFSICDDRVTPANRGDLELAIAFALRFSGRKRIRSAGEIMATIAAERIVAHLEEAGFVIMRKPPGVDAAA